MANVVTSEKKQSKSEERRYHFDFGPDIPSGATITSVVSVTHIPPDGGTATTPVAEDVEGSIVPVLLGPVDITGWHSVVVLVELSSDERVDVKLNVEVIY